MRIGIKGRMRNQFNDGLKRQERLPAPVDGNVRKQPVLDFVPFAGGRRKMTDGDGKAGLIGKSLQLLLPQPIANPIGTTAVSHNE